MELISKKPLSYDDDTWMEEELLDLIEASYERFKNKANEINFDSDIAVVIQSEHVQFRFSTKCGAEIITPDTKNYGTFYNNYS